MSGEELPYWCYSCAEWFVLRGEEEVCPYCHEGFVKNFTGMSFWCTRCDWSCNIKCSYGAVNVICPHCDGSDDSDEEEEEEDEPTITFSSSIQPSASNATLTVTVTEDDINDGQSQCCICMEEFEVGSDVKKTLCNHIFHEDCLERWFLESNSCPICRYVTPPEGTEQLNIGSSEAGTSRGRGRLRMTLRRWLSSLNLG